MPNNIDIVKKLNDACMSKDVEAAKALLHPQYTLKDPMMEINGAQEFLDMMKSCPFDNKLENVNYIADGNNVVGTFDIVATKPVSSRMRMCSIITLEDNKVRSEETFYDTAKIPKEVMEMMKKSMADKKKAA